MIKKSLGFAILLFAGVIFMACDELDFDFNYTLDDVIEMFEEIQHDYNLIVVEQKDDSGELLRRERLDATDLDAIVLHVFVPSLDEEDDLEYHVLFTEDFIYNTQDMSQTAHNMVIETFDEVMPFIAAYSELIDIAILNESYLRSLTDDLQAIEWGLALPRFTLSRRLDDIPNGEEGVDYILKFVFNTSRLEDLHIERFDEVTDDLLNGTYFTFTSFELDVFPDLGLFS